MEAQPISEDEGEDDDKVMKKTPKAKKVWPGSRVNLRSQ
jgi:hypothetical protein